MYAVFYFLLQTQRKSLYELIAHFPWIVENRNIKYSQQFYTRLYKNFVPQSIETPWRWWQSVIESLGLFKNKWLFLNKNPIYTRCEAVKNVYYKISLATMVYLCKKGNAQALTTQSKNNKTMKNAVFCIVWRPTVSKPNAAQHWALAHSKERHFYYLNHQRTFHFHLFENLQNFFFKGLKNT